MSHKLWEKMKSSRLNNKVNEVHIFKQSLSDLHWKVSLVCDNSTVTFVWW